MKYFRGIRAVLALAFVCAAGLVLLTCGGSAGKSPSGSGFRTTVPQFSHVAIIVLENQQYSDVVGSTSMPYLNGLIAQNGLAANYFANAHPSLPNYFMLTVGQTVTNTDNFTGTVADDNVVRRLVAGGKSWRAYMQAIPTAAYMGPDVYPYTKHHNPFAYLTDVLNSPAQYANIVGLDRLMADAGANAIPNFLFIVPDDLHNAHDCNAGPTYTTCPNQERLTAADNFLRNEIAPLLANSEFQQNGLLFIVFDESLTADVQGGGGRIATVVVSPLVKPGFVSTTFYQHENLLNTAMQALGLTAPGAAATATPMTDLFQ